MKFYRLFSDANRFRNLVAFPGRRWWPKSLDSTLAPFGGDFEDLEGPGNQDFPFEDNKLTYWGTEYRSWSKSSAFHFSCLVVDASLMAVIRKHQSDFSLIRPLAVVRGDYDSHLLIPQVSRASFDPFNSDILQTESGSYLASGGIEFSEEPTENLFLLPNMPFSDVYASEILVAALASTSDHGLVADLVWHDGRRSFLSRPTSIEPNSPLYSVEESTVADRFLLTPESFDGPGLSSYMLRGLQRGILRY